MVIMDADVVVSSAAANNDDLDGHPYTTLYFVGCVSFSLSFR